MDMEVHITDTDMGMDTGILTTRITRTRGTVITGILVGLIEGAVTVNQGLHTGQIFISTPPNRNYIDNTSEIVSILDQTPEVTNYSVRYLSAGTAEANYNRVLRADELPNTAGGLVAGIDPWAEEQTTHLSRKIIEGEFCLAVIKVSFTRDDPMPTKSSTNSAPET